MALFAGKSIALAETWENWNSCKYILQKKNVTDTDKKKHFARMHFNLYSICRHHVMWRGWFLWSLFYFVASWFVLLCFCRHHIKNRFKLFILFSFFFLCKNKALMEMLKQMDRVQFELISSNEHVFLFFIYFCYM